MNPQETSELATSKQGFRQGVQDLESRMFAAEQVDIVPVHHFAKGVYAREITIPAGTLLTGKIHRHSQINIISKGHIAIRTEDGVIDVHAPATVVSPPGVKRIGYAHTETVWTTISGTDETDVDKLELILTAPSFEDYEQGLLLEGGAECLGLPQQ